METIGIAAILIAIALLILVAFLVPTIVQLRQTAKQVAQTTANLDKTLPGIMSNLEDISTNMNAILHTGRKQVESMSEAVSDVKGMIDDVVTFEKRLKNRVEMPVMQTVSTLNAAAKAVQVFFAVMGGKDNHSNNNHR